jgi:hypothetical protein
VPSYSLGYTYDILQPGLPNVTTEYIVSQNCTADSSQALPSIAANNGILRDTTIIAVHYQLHLFVDSCVMSCHVIS